MKKFIIPTRAVRTVNLKCYLSNYKPVNNLCSKSLLTFYSQRPFHNHQVKPFKKVRKAFLIPLASKLWIRQSKAGDHSEINTQIRELISKFETLYQLKHCPIPNNFLSQDKGAAIDLITMIHQELELVDKKSNRRPISRQKISCGTKNKSLIDDAYVNSITYKILHHILNKCLNIENDKML